LFRSGAELQPAGGKGLGTPGRACLHPVGC
jgi:hypothetical protein